MAVAADLAADRADPFATFRTERLGRERQVQLFEDHLPDIDLAAPVEKLVQVLLTELVLEPVELLRQENQVDELEMAIDLECTKILALRQPKHLI